MTALTQNIGSQTAGTGRWQALAAADPKRAFEARARGVEVAEDFGQVFVQQLVEGLRRTSDPTGSGEGPFGDGPGSDTYTMWFDRLFGERIAAANGMEVADTIIAQLEKLEQIPRPDDLLPHLQRRIDGAGSNPFQSAIRTPEASTDVLA